jgi:hypothetical protein
VHVCGPAHSSVCIISHSKKLRGEVVLGN